MLGGPSAPGVGKQKPRSGRAGRIRGQTTGQAASLQSLVRAACLSLGRSSDEADAWTQCLEAEWVCDPAQLRTLSTQEWARLGLPLGLEAELRRRTAAEVDVAAGAQPTGAARPQSAPPARARIAGAAQGQAVSRAAAGGNPRRPADAAVLRRELGRQLGEEWSLALLRAMRRSMGAERCADLDGLQAAFRLLGITSPAASPAALRALLRDAAALGTGGGSGGVPDAEAVVAVLHGPLKGRRAEAVRVVFEDLDSDGCGRLATSSLRRRLNPLEHPAVKAGQLSAEEAQRAMLRKWRGHEAVSVADFLAAHVPISALAPGDDAGFSRLVRALWRLERRCYDFPGVDNLVLQEVQEGSSLGSSASRISTPRIGADPRRALPQEENRRRVLEDRIKRSTGSRDLLERLRTVLRRRGARGSGLGGDDMLAALARRFRAAAGGRRPGRGLEPESLHAALKQVGVGATAADVEELLTAMDIDGNGAVDFEEWLRVVRGPLRGPRVTVVHEAFSRLDRDGDGVVSMADLQAAYEPAGQPHVEAGRMDRDEAARELLSNFADHGRDGRLTLADFERYYEGVSAGIDSDQYFKHIVRTAWGLDTDAHSRYARNLYRAKDGHLQVSEGGLIGRNDGW